MSNLFQQWIYTNITISYICVNVMMLLYLRWVTWMNCFAVFVLNKLYFVCFVVTFLMIFCTCDYNKYCRFLFVHCFNSLSKSFMYNGFLWLLNTYIRFSIFCQTTSSTFVVNFELIVEQFSSIVEKTPNPYKIATEAIFLNDR